MKLGYVYIMTNKPNGVIYIGVTDNIDERVKEHKNMIYPKLSQQDITVKLQFILKNLKMEKKH